MVLDLEEGQACICVQQLVQEHLRCEPGRSEVQELDETIDRIVQRLVLIVKTDGESALVTGNQDLLAGGDMSGFHLPELLNISQQLFPVISVALFFRLHWGFRLISSLSCGSGCRPGRRGLCLTSFLRFLLIFGLLGARLPSFHGSSKVERLGKIGADDGLLALHFLLLLLLCRLLIGLSQGFLDTDLITWAEQSKQVFAHLRVEHQVVVADLGEVLLKKLLHLVEHLDRFVLEDGRHLRQQLVHKAGPRQENEDVLGDAANPQVVAQDTGPALQELLDDSLRVLVEHRGKFLLSNDPQ